MEKKLLPPELAVEHEPTKGRKRQLMTWFLVMAVVVLSVCFVISLMLVFPQCISDMQAPMETFKAAAYEQKLVSVRNAVTRDEALKAMRANLANMEKQAEIAGLKGVNVMVFAEYGITGDMGVDRIPTRRSVYPYMEEIPDVSVTKPACVSCDKIDPKVEGQTTIGCIALKYNMYVLANLIESVPCDNTLDNQCPSDGHYQYNTNIVYNPKGCLIAKYHKYHRFSEEFTTIDKPPQPEHVYFDTEYGRFGVFICADILYENPPLSLVEQYGVHHILFPTYWIQNGLAFLSAVDWQLAYATLAKVNFVSAAVYSPEDYVFGSSILSGSTVINCTTIDRSSQGMLITGDLPCSKPSNSEIFDEEVLRPSTPRGSQTALIIGDLFNVVTLDGLSGSVHVCQSSLCCSLDYNRNSTDEAYVLGAFKGLHEFGEPLAAEVCLLTKCMSENLTSCGEPETTSATSFPHLKLSANFSVQYVYPNLSPANFEYKKLNWSFHHTSSDFYNSIVSWGDWPMVAVGLVGRDFENDPQI